MKKQCFYKVLTFYNAPITWAIDNGSNNGPLTIRGNSIYNEELHSESSCLLREDLELLAMSSLVRSFGYLPQILSVHIYITKPLVYACMPL